jgi:hypothetical protein
MPNDKQLQASTMGIHAPRSDICPKRKLLFLKCLSSNILKSHLPPSAAHKRVEMTQGLSAWSHEDGTGAPMNNTHNNCVQ